MATTTRRAPRADLTGRRLQVLTVAQLLAEKVDGRPVQMVKLAQLKYRRFPATRVKDAQQARSVVADLPPDAQLLLAD